jgi:hypothetical protein
MTEDELQAVEQRHLAAECAAGYVSGADGDTIAASLADTPDLVAAVRRLRAALTSIAQEEPSSAPGFFVRGESSADECSGCGQMIRTAAAALAARDG